MATDPLATLYANGIDPATGGYHRAPIEPRRLAAWLRGPHAEAARAALAAVSNAAERPFAGLDPRDLGATGWGVVAAAGADRSLLDALEPLLARRRQQAGSGFQVLERGAGEPVDAFRARHGADPGRWRAAGGLPYYLLLLGDAEAIPFSFQLALGRHHGVGRLTFERIEDYRRYAERVVAAETADQPPAPSAGVFGAIHAGDPATDNLGRGLLRPLLATLERNDLLHAVALGDQATKARLGALLEGRDRPSLLITAGHGLAGGDSARRRAWQGALVCAGHPIPAPAGGGLDREQVFAAADLAADADLRGAIHLQVGSFGAGSASPPSPFTADPAAQRTGAEAGFVAALPQALLAAGALASIGQVDAAWAFSVADQDPETARAVDETVAALAHGLPAGAALAPLHRALANLAAPLGAALDAAAGDTASDRRLAALWTAAADAAGWALLGDPAIRLPSTEHAAAFGGRGSRKRPATPARDRGGDQPAMAEPPPPPPAVAPEPPPPPPRASIDLEAPVGPEVIAEVRPEVITEVRPEGITKIGAEEIEFAAAGSRIESGSLGPAWEPDEVLFSAFGPRRVEPRVWRALLAYAHLEGATAAVYDDAGAQLGAEAAGYRPSHAEPMMSIVPGTVIRLVPRLPGFEVLPAHVDIAWYDQWQRADFVIRATEAERGRSHLGAIDCFVGPLLVAEIPLAVTVSDGVDRVGGTKRTRSPLVGRSAKAYRAVFASYSHRDQPVVEAVEKAYRALGMDYLRDVVTLRSGQRWNAELLRMIERADIFQLFWSERAKASKYVEQEWRHALSLADDKGEGFVRPVYWQRPLPDVPPELGHLHFAPADFAGFEPAAPPPDRPAPPTPPRAAAAGPTRPLTVDTYTADDPADPAAGRLVARSRFDFAGDVETRVAAELDAAGRRALALHRELVRDALDSRLRYLALGAPEPDQGEG